MTCRTLLSITLFILLNCRSVRAQDNSWVDSGSGDWESPEWSSGLPGTNQNIFITNSGTKTVVMESTTALNYRDTLSIGSLTLASPGKVTNELWMNGAGLEVPLVIGETNDYSGSLTIADSNSVVEIDSSSLIVNGNMMIFGQFNETSGSVVNEGGEMDLGGYVWNYRLINATNAGTFNLSDGYLATSSLNIYYCADPSGVLAYPSIFNQTGGYHTNGSMNLEGNQISITDAGWFWAIATCSYNLSGGTLATGGIGTWYSVFNQTGGTNIVNSVNAQYNLSGGQLIAQNFGGGMTQTGGTNHSQELGGWGYSLSNGMVIASNLYVGMTFAQSGGVLMASNIQMERGTFQHNGGVCTASLVIFDQGTWREQAGEEDLGQLQLGPSGYSIIQFPSNTCTLRFADSSGLNWSNTGILSIQNWSGSLAGGGSNRIFFGTNRSGLTAEQLGRIQFQAPAGLSWGYYLAKILPTGELVPGYESYLDLLPAPFFTGEVPLNEGWYYLSQSNTFFGYYNLDLFPYVYHEDMGWEYFMDAGNTNNGAYFYDFTDGAFFYTEPALFPYVYDFKANSWLYYEPLPNTAGRYSSNPRWFFKYSTQAWVNHF
jgi:hypothetical protein